MTALSVIIPVYNAEKYLRQTLSSVLEQSLKDIEVICIDDGSTDASCDIIREFMKKDDRVRLLNQKNSYAGVARNYGLSVASGEYVHFLDADDYCLKYGYEAVVAKAKNRDLDCLKFCAIPYNEKTKKTVYNAGYILDLFGEGDFMRLLSPEKDRALFLLSATPWSGIYKRQFLIDNEVRFNDLFCVNDRSFFIKVITNAKRIMASKDWVLVHRMGMSSSLVGKRAKHFSCQEESLHIIENQLLQDGVSEEVFSKVMDFEINDLLIWGQRLGGDAKHGSEIIDNIERIIDEYAGKYASLRKFRGNVNRLRKRSKDRSLKQKEDISFEIYHDRCRKPKVSVVVPTYNQEEYLNVALNSLAAQTLKEMEFICINDGSTDSSLTILKQFADLDKRFVIIDKKNTGYGNSMNVGIDAASGEYLGILEPDDFVTSGMFEKLYKTASQKNLDWVKGDFYRFYTLNDGSIKTDRFRLSGDSSYYGRVIKPLKDKEVFKFTMNTWSGIYSLKFLNKWHIRHNETPGASYQDNGFWFQTFCRAERGWFVKTPYYMNRRDNPNSSMFNKGKSDAITKEYDYILNWLNKDPKLLLEVEDIYYYKKFRNFLTTYYRLATELKRDYLHHFKREFDKPYKDGKLKKELFDLGQWELFEEIMDDPDAFYDKIRVSVIIPAYNGEKYIGGCLDSILARDEVRSEVICVDDGSTDNTLSILQEYAAKDSRVKVISQKNAGAGAARNNGMKYATGEYMMFLDADDYFDPEMLRRTYNTGSYYKSDVTVFRSDQYIEQTQQIIENPSTIKETLLPNKKTFAPEEIKDNIFGAFIGWPWDKMFRTEFVKENGLQFQEQRTTNDLLFVFSAIVKAESICTIDRVMAHHRRLEAGESLSVSREKSWDCFYRALYALREQLREWGMYERYERDFINYSLHFSLWNLRTIRGNAYFLLYDKLKEEWLDDLGITGKDKDYFYNAYEYELGQRIMKSSANEFLFDLINDVRLETSALKEKNAVLSGNLADANAELKTQIKKSARAMKMYESVTNNSAYSAGRKIARVYRKIRKK